MHARHCIAAIRDAWLAAFETAKMVTQKDARGVRRRNVPDAEDEEDYDEDDEEDQAYGAVPTRRGIILEVCACVRACVACVACVVCVACVACVCVRRSVQARVQPIVEMSVVTELARDRPTDRSSYVLQQRYKLTTDWHLLFFLVLFPVSYTHLTLPTIYSV